MTPLLTCTGNDLKGESGFPLGAKFKNLGTLIAGCVLKFGFLTAMEVNAPRKHAVSGLQAMPPSFLSLWLAPQQPTDPE